MKKKYETNGKGTDFGGKPTVRIENVYICNETAKAWLLRIEDDQPRTVFWVPKSQCQLHTHSKNKRLHDLEIIKSIAQEKGLLEDAGYVDDKDTMAEFDRMMKERGRK